MVNEQETRKKKKKKKNGLIGQERREWGTMTLHVIHNHIC